MVGVGVDMEDEMDDKLNALDYLIEAVEDGVMPLDGSSYKLFGDGWIHVFDAYHGSLDAALALHEALLPGWALERLNKWPGTNGQCTAYLWGTHEEDGERWHNAKDGRVDATAPTPARAWLQAILRAYRSVQA